jgi:hypothetical protein
MMTLRKGEETGMSVIWMGGRRVMTIKRFEMVWDIVVGSELIEFE